MRKKVKNIKKINKEEKITILKNSIKELKKELFKVNIYNFSNLFKKSNKIFLETIKHTYLYLIFLFLIIFSSKLLGEGYPFIKDDITKYLIHELDYNETNYVELYSYDTLFNVFMTEKYKDSDYIKIYEPWKLDKDIYSRVVKTYKFNKDLNVIKLLKNKEYEDISEYLELKDSEVQKTNYVDENNNDYIIDVKYFELLDERIEVKENNLHNLLVTIIELLIFSILVVIKKYLIYDENYSKYSLIIKDIIRNYPYIDTTLLEDKINVNNKKLLKLKRQEDE